jgi:hypothetical protein
MRTLPDVAVIILYHSCYESDSGNEEGKILFSYPSHKLFAILPIDMTASIFRRGDIRIPISIQKAMQAIKRGIYARSRRDEAVSSTATCSRDAALP